MVNLRDLEKSQKNVKDFVSELSGIVEKLWRLLELQKYKKKKGFKKYIGMVLADLLIKVIRMAKYFRVDIEEQFEEWWIKRNKMKKFSVKEGYNKIAEEYDKLYNVAILTEQPKFLKLIGNVRGKKVLDIGCGTGRYSIELTKKGATVTGVDISEKMLEIARKKSKKLKINFKRANATNLPFKDNEFDLVISALAIEHVKDYKKAISEMIRVCKPNGHIIFSMLHPNTLSDYAVFGNVLIKRYKKGIGDLVTALNKEGAVVEKVYELNVPKKFLNKVPLDLFFYLRNKKFVLIIKSKKIRNF